MTNAELIALYRLLADDAIEPYFVSDASVQLLLKDAEDEAAIRGRLIHESADNSICQISVTAGTATYELDPVLYELTHVAFIDADDNRHPIKLVSTEALDYARDTYARLIPPAGDDYDVGITREDWRDATGTPPVYAVQTDRQLRLVPNPTADGTLQLEGYRTTIGDIGDDPEIAVAHHRHLVQWVLYKTFTIPDSDYMDANRSMLALSEFERYFGLRPDADLRRITRHDTPHHVEPHFI